MVFPSLCSSTDLVWQQPKGWKTAIVYCKGISLPSVSIDVRLPEFSSHRVQEKGKEEEEEGTVKGAGIAFFSK